MRHLMKSPEPAVQATSVAPPERIAPPIAEHTAPIPDQPQNGVLHPPQNIDPGIKEPSPSTGKFPMPVIPPGSTGNHNPTGGHSPNVQAK